MRICALCVLLVVFLAVFALARHIRRAQARAMADRIIAGKAEANAVEINRCIEVLVSGSIWLTAKPLQDEKRIKRLREIQNHLLQQQTSIFQRNPLRRK